MTRWQFIKKSIILTFQEMRKDVRSFRISKTAISFFLTAISFFLIALVFVINGVVWFGFGYLLFLLGVPWWSLPLLPALCFGTWLWWVYNHSKVVDSIDDELE